MDIHTYGKPLKPVVQLIHQRPDNAPPPTKEAKEAPSVVRLGKFRNLGGLEWHFIHFSVFPTYGCLSVGCFNAASILSSVKKKTMVPSVGNFAMICHVNCLSTCCQGTWRDSSDRWKPWVGFVSTGGHRLTKKKSWKSRKKFEHLWTGLT